MSKSETIRARVEPDVKEEAEAVLHELGLSPSQALTLFYRQIALRRGLPFDVRIPNAETRAAMQQALDGEELTDWDSLDALKRQSA